MKISKARLFKTSSLMKQPVQMSTGLISYAENLVVRLDDDAGNHGWGEAAAAPSMTGETLDGMFAAACYLSPFLLSRSWPDIASAREEMERRLPRNQAVKAAIDIALHDLLGKQTGQSVSALLGQPRRSRIDTLALIGAGSIQGDVAVAIQAVGNGHTALKLKVGTSTVEQDSERVLAVRKAVGFAPLLCADANGAWRVDETERFLGLIAGAKLAYLEQPVAPEAIGGTAMLYRNHGVPIGLDESLRSFDDLRHAHEAQLAQGGSFKLIKIGGLKQLVDAAEEAFKRGYGVNLAGKVAETGISTAALLHAAAVSPEIAWGCSPSNSYLVQDIVEPELKAVRGSVAVPEGPGLGIAVNEARLMERTLEHREFDAPSAAA